MKKEMRLVQCTVNGRPVAEYVDVRESLLDIDVYKRQLLS